MEEGGRAHPGVEPAIMTFAGKDASGELNANQYSDCRAIGNGEVSDDAVGTSGKAIPGWCATWEVAGGVRGNNRLGGNSLLGCVVFGRVACEATLRRR